jgi:DNA-binding transcriptional LysR family regulator
MRPVLATTLTGAERVFASAPGFDPGSARREFSLLATDYWVATIGARLLRLVRREAPYVAFQFGDLTPAVIDQATETLRVWDGAVAPIGVLGGLSHEPLVASRWVCVVDGDTTTVGDTLTVDDLNRLPWIVVAVGPADSAAGRTSSVAMDQLSLHGITPRVAMTTESFLAVPRLVAGTDCIAFLQQPLAQEGADRHGLRILEPPVVMPELVQALWWHPLHDHDPGHAWLRRRIGEAAAANGSPSDIGVADARHRRSGVQVGGPGA